MRIRLATKDDVRGILAVQQRSPEAARWIQSDYERLLDDPGGKVLVAELPTMDPPKVLGFAAFHRVIDEVELRNMAVDPNHREQGIGRALLLAARDRMLMAGAKRVFLEVRASNKPAQSLYHSLGFAIHSLRKDYYRDPPEDALVLSLEIYPPTVLAPPWAAP
jgi:ribosomal-protein-alanine N-acetyltransferase